MRDIRRFVKNHERRIYLNGAQIQTVMDRQVTVDSQRSDSVSTQKVAGTYIYPTAYDATFSVTSVQGCTAEWRVHQWPYTGKWSVYKAVADGSTTEHFPGHPNWGCNQVTKEPQISAETLNIARDRALAKLRDGAWQAGTFLAELDETIGMLMNPLGSFNSILSRLAKLSSSGLLKKGELLAKPVAELYLLNQFGLQPLVQDTYSILSLIEKKFEETNQGKPLVAKAVVMDPYFRAPQVSELYAGYGKEVKGKATRGAEVSASFGIADPGRYQLWRYGLDNPFSFVWERIPLSFVVDWYLHIGSYLRALIPPAGLVFLHGYELVFLKNAFSISDHIIPLDGYVANRSEMVSSTPRITHYHTTAMRRRALVSPPVPLPYLSMGLTNRGKALSLLALITQRWR